MRTRFVSSSEWSTVRAPRSCRTRTCSRRVCARAPNFSPSSMPTLRARHSRNQRADRRPPRILGLGGAVAENRIRDVTAAAGSDSLVPRAPRPVESINPAPETSSGRYTFRKLGGLARPDTLRAAIITPDGRDAFALGTLGAYRWRLGLATGSAPRLARSRGLHGIVALPGARASAVRRARHRSALPARERRTMAAARRRREASRSARQWLRDHSGGRASLASEGRVRRSGVRPSA